MQQTAAVWQDLDGNLTSTTVNLANRGIGQKVFQIKQQHVVLQLVWLNSNSSTSKITLTLGTVRPFIMKCSDKEAKDKGKWPEDVGYPSKQKRILTKRALKLRANSNRCQKETGELFRGKPASPTGRLVQPVVHCFTSKDVQDRLLL